MPVQISAICDTCGAFVARQVANVNNPLDFASSDGWVFESKTETFQKYVSSFGSGESYYSRLEVTCPACRAKKKER